MSTVVESVVEDEHGAAEVEAPGMVQAERADDGPAVLVRPDGYIGWTGASAREWAGATASIAGGAIAAPRVAAG